MKAFFTIVMLLFSWLSLADDGVFTTPEPDEAHPFASVETADVIRILARPEEGLQVIRFRAVRKNKAPVASDISVPKYLEARFRDGEFLILFTDAEKKDNVKNYYTNQELGEAKERQLEAQFQLVFGKKRRPFAISKIVMPPPPINQVPKADKTANWTLTKVIEAVRKEDKSYRMMVRLESRLKTRRVFDDSIMHAEFDSSGRLQKIAGVAGFTEDTFKVEWDRQTLMKSDDGKRTILGVEAALRSLFQGLIDDKAVAVAK